MHNGRTIEELIKLVQRINTERGTYPKVALNLNESNSTKSSPSARSSEKRTEPTWLAVFQ